MSAARPLPPTQLHLYLVDPSTLLDPAVVRRSLAVLTPEEQVRHDRFRFPEHRHHYLVTRALVRTTLSRYVARGPADWRFTQNSHGRPELPEPELSWLRFNLSNTDGLVACVVARDREVGVDVEDTQRHGNQEGVAERFFAPAEVRALHALPEAAQHRRFFEYWTLKESYIKARGLGLSIPLGKFAFNLAGPVPGLHCEDELGDRGEDWQFQQLWPTPRHAAAVAIRRGSDAPLTLHTEWVRPLVD
ncbi:MAG: 4'-phosphopantetheinyl transferase superfamily protein [Myxococcota bacterium]|nr:4'-phosphopantetheinyl transferase superfamily protein [Myxococcota bacterium]